MIVNKNRHNDRSSGAGLLQREVQIFIFLGPVTKEMIKISSASLFLRW